MVVPVVVSRSLLEIFSAVLMVVQISARPLTQTVYEQDEKDAHVCQGYSFVAQYTLLGRWSAAARSRPPHTV
jgi:hypothetical protein